MVINGDISLGITTIKKLCGVWFGVRLSREIVYIEMVAQDQVRRGGEANKD